MMHLPVRSRYYVLLLFLVAISLINLLRASRRLLSVAGGLRWEHDNSSLRDNNINLSQGEVNNATIRHEVPLSTLEKEFFIWGDPKKKPRPKPPYKLPKPPAPPVPDPFPLLSQNPPPGRSVLRGPNAREQRYHQPTPLFVGFTRNWPQLLQCVVSYIAAGWPPEEIYVVENTGVMHANRDGKLTLQNPFYLNHTQLGMLGVNVVITPTLLTFAQLQNFYLWTALHNFWPHFFWTHQDVLVFSYENATSTPSSSPSSPSNPPTLHTNALSTLHFLTSPTSSAPKWAHHFFFYDHLALVNRDAVLSVGGWDTHIPFYGTDCDMYVRLMWAGFWQGQSDIGMIFDVGDVLEDLGALLRIRGVKGKVRGWGAKVGEEGERGGKEDEDVKEHGESWKRLVELAYRMEVAKYTKGNAGRNKWQALQRGGQSEPFYRDADGFEIGIKMHVDAGRAVFAEKWGHRGCDIARMGIKAEEAWRLERDWDEATEGRGFEGDEW